MGLDPRTGSFLRKMLFGEPNNPFNTTHNLNPYPTNSNHQAHVNDLKTIFDKFIDSNQEGESKGVIDKQEAQNANGRIYFVYENMKVDDFIRINIGIYEQSGELNMGKSDTETYISRNNTNSTLSKEIGKVITDIINNGQFEEKKDIILPKLKYLDIDTFNELKSLLPEQEQIELEQKYQNP